MVKDSKRLQKVRRRLKLAAGGADGLPESDVSEERSADGEPVPDELFSVEQMEQHGVRLAGAHRLTTRRRPDRLLPRLAANENLLLETCRQLTVAVAAQRRITPAGDWLLDNFYLVEEQIRTTRRHLPKGYSRELPSLRQRAAADRPRVYDLALEAIAHSDGRVDPDGLGRFIAAYQTVAPLMLGELWAIPIMLRLALIENLGRVATRIGAGRTDRELALEWAGKLMETARSEPKNLIVVIADMARSNPPLTTPFVSELTRQLQGHGPALALPLTWVEQQLAESGQSIEQLVRSGTQQQASDQVSVSNSIGSLRSIGTIDWREFVESMSLVDRTLCEDPAGTYVAMDFASRDRYRHAVEGLAKRAQRDETEVARCAVDLARVAAGCHGEGDRTAHVGYYLIDLGREVLAASVEPHPSRMQRWRRWPRRHSVLAYLGSIVVLTLLITGIVLLKSWSNGTPGWTLAGLCVLTLLASSHLVVAVVNWVATLVTLPNRLPRLDFRNGIPQQFRSLVVVPTLLTSVRTVEDLVEALEVRYLGNREQHLYFGLLTDFPDADAEILPDDGPLLRLASARIEALNARYASGGDDVFFLFHRARRWNPYDRVWMGYERKRGKLADLNVLLRTGVTQGFAVVVGDPAVLSGVRFVITLDTDTHLPRDAARLFVATMAHPLNRPVYDADLGRVTAGYGILQPRVSVGLPDTPPTRFVRLHGAESGIDPYTRVVSDVYQDVFGEGSFIGKGIYDVEAFEQALSGRFPENRILSHDLLEGCYARAGLLSDVQLYEEHPARYQADVDRRHRWIRGDWQLAAWLLPWVPGSKGGLNRNPLSAHSRWKVLDNLRRSLVPAGLTLLLLLGWTVLASPALWTLLVLGVVLVPSVLAFLVDLVQKPNGLRWAQHLRAVANVTATRAAQAGLYLTTLPYEAYYSLDAILRTLIRLLLTHQNLLEWRASTERSPDLDGLPTTYRAMWFAVALALVTAAGLTVGRPAALLVAMPLLLAWVASPAVVWWISQPIPRVQIRLTPDEERFLSRTARRTWAFFEETVAADDHWLPPDNYQEDRDPVLAHRTSPTNIGLALLSTLAAADFGYLPAGVLLDRIAKTLATVGRLERYRGHFLNWYDTQSLRPLHPVYVSTVDSGNFAGHLLTLRAGLAEIPDRPVVEARWLDGLATAADVLRHSWEGDAPAAVVEFQHAIDDARDAPPGTLGEAWHLLGKLCRAAHSLVDDSAGAPADAVWWASVLCRQCRSLRDEVAFLAPWLENGIDETPAYPGLDYIPTLRAMTMLDQAPEVAGSEAAADTGSEDLVAWRKQVRLGSERARQRLADVERLLADADDFATMEYGFLYDEKSRLLSIGYNVEEHRRDPGNYDLLASEVRLGVFVAIAQREIPQESWFALGRLLTTVGGAPILLSWSGSMFEYLMPQLVMPSYENTLLDQTVRGAVARQIDYGQQHNVPWGMSESGYSAWDVNLNYQYRAFGVPGLGLKRGLEQDLVIAPYAAVMALMVDPAAACRNLKRLVDLGVDGRFGFHEALDYTPARQRHGDTLALVRSYMVHHQGMSLLALAYRLLNRPMQRRFMSDPLLRATLLLLQERIPRATANYTDKATTQHLESAMEVSHPTIRVVSDPSTPVPEVQLLSNGSYHVMVTQAGGGYSRWNDLDVTRWREDVTRDHWGTFCYLQEASRTSDGAAVWSVSHQPTLRPADGYEAIFSEGRAEFRRRDGDFESHTEIVVSPEDDIELRRIRITNLSARQRDIVLTSCAEVVLATAAADALHPAFSKLFVETEILPADRAILCTRRPRSRGEVTPRMFHLMAIHGAEFGEASFETDRAQFIGRGRTLAAPQALDTAAALSGRQGAVLDPMVAIRSQVALGPEQSVTVDLVYGVAPTRADALALIDKYQDRHLADRVFELAWTHAQVVLRQINATDAEAQLYGRLANAILYSHAALRADNAVLLRNRRGQSGLWGYAVSGDLPIVLVSIGDSANLELVRQAVQAHAYWRLKGLSVDLVIWNEDRAGYRQELQERILDLVAMGLQASSSEHPGGIYVRSSEQISEEDRTLFASVARLILSDRNGTLAEQLGRGAIAGPRVPLLVPSSPHEPQADVPEAPRELILFNGSGGFTPDGREYVITSSSRRTTPAPWSNVLANAHFGSVVSESGQCYTWGENAHEFRLTPWHNDPVIDPGGELFYLRDEETGHTWSPTPLPGRGSSPYVTRHGFGYSVFEHTEAGIASELCMYVAHDAPVKFFTLRLRNLSGRSRRLSATGYVEWVLGDLRSRTAMHVTTQVDLQSGALLARAHYNTEFAGRVAFFDTDEAHWTFTCDRTEFLGRNGSAELPAAMTRTHLSGRVGAGLDPCAAIQVVCELAPGQDRELIFRLGLGGIPDLEPVGSLLTRSRGSEVARRTLAAVHAHWQRTLGAVQVQTPDEAVNVLCNGWLLYQILSSRMHGRSGYYQSGGAFGFRDQLQDAMALVHAEPQLLRAQILLCASRQFQEGDVQHWWHPPSGRGVRSRCSDDYLWLPLATSRYVRTTGDIGVLDEDVAFLVGRALGPGEESYYDLPERTAGAESVYEHCLRAIRQGLRFGVHGLPLIGSGDWNDGMDRVGRQGSGESVWLGFFLCEVLRQFRTLAQDRGDRAVVEWCTEERSRLAENLDRHGWDGGWYRRAYFDDGTPLGSAASAECRIDSISQSWAVISGAADEPRAREAMMAVDRLLVRREESLVALLAPPFDQSDVDPGYIKGYLPGVRENGGQYTHAAVWAAMAFAALGDAERAWEIARMINPVNHTRSPEGVMRYRVEPYVMAADVYAIAPHTGRGGWTWYTGSAAWMYRLLLESLLGLRLDADRLHLDPCLPSEWHGFSMRYRYCNTVFDIEVVQPTIRPGSGRLLIDGVEQTTPSIPLVDDGRTHAVQFEI